MNAELGFQRLHGLGDGGLRQVQLLGSRAEAALVGDGQECLSWARFMAGLLLRNQRTNVKPELPAVGLARGSL